MEESDKYLHQFVSLKTAVKDGKKAPHKAVLLLAIASMVKSGEITENHIVLSEPLVDCFNRIWKDRVPTSSPFSPKVTTPHWHMQNEPFYNLFFNDGTKVTPIDNPYSVSKLRKLVYAQLDEGLFTLLKDEAFYAEMEAVLTINYLEP